MSETLIPPTDCKHCESKRFRSRGAIWCRGCDKASIAELATRTPARRR